MGGRCLFRVIGHMACLNKGEDVPDENHQRELANELRGLVCFKSSIFDLEVFNSLLNFGGLFSLCLFLVCRLWMSY